MDQMPNSHCSSSNPPITPKNNMPVKTKMMILSPDILNKLGIASQISNLTRLATENSNNKNLEEMNVDHLLNAKNALENEIKLRLSKSLNKSFDRIENVNKTNNTEQSLTPNNSNENNTVINKPNPPKNKIIISEIKIIKRGNNLPRNIIHSHPLEKTKEPQTDLSIESIHLCIAPQEKTIENINDSNDEIINVNIKRSQRIENNKKKIDDNKGTVIGDKCNQTSNKKVPKPIVNVSKNVKRNKCSITLEEIDEFPSFSANCLKTYSRRQPKNVKIPCDKANTVNESDKDNSNITGKQISNQEICIKNSVETSTKNISSINDDKKDGKSFTEICNESDNLNKNFSDISQDKFLEENKSPLVISFTEQSCNNFDENSLADIPIIFEDQLLNYSGNCSLMSLEVGDISMDDSNIKLITIPSSVHNENISNREVEKNVDLLSSNIRETVRKEGDLIEKYMEQQNNDEVLVKEEKINESNTKFSTVINIKDKLLDETQHITEITEPENVVDKTDKGIIRKDKIEDLDLVVENVRNMEVAQHQSCVVDEEIDKTFLKDKKLQDEENNDNVFDMPKQRKAAIEIKNEEKQCDKFLQKSEEETISKNNDINNEKEMVGELNKTDFEAEQYIKNTGETSACKNDVEKTQAMNNIENERGIINEGNHDNESGIQKKQAMKIDTIIVDKLQVISEFPEQRRTETRAELEESTNDLEEGIGVEESVENLAQNKEKEFVKPLEEHRGDDKIDDVALTEKKIGLKKLVVKTSKMSNECAIKIKEELHSSREDMTIEEVALSPGTSECDTPPKKRGRPVKNKGKIIAVVRSEIQPDTETPVRRRGRPPKTTSKLSKTNSSKPLFLHHEVFIKEEDDTSPSNVNPSTTSCESTPKNARGRKRKPVPNSNTDNGVKVVKCSMVECGVCKEVINNIQWTHHLAKHNYLAWRVGEEAIDLEDRKAVERVLFRAVKERKATFVCEHCGSKKKSVLGYLGHKELCQISDEERLNRRVPCPICARLFQPSSFRWHYKTHENESRNVSPSPPDDQEVRGKRKAASKAASLIQNVCKADESEAPQFVNTKFYKKYSEINKLFSYIGISRRLEDTYRKFGSITCKVRHCTHRTTSFKQLKYHVQKCPHLEIDDFICSICLFISKDENEINEHVSEVHKKNSDGHEFQCNDNEEDANENDSPEENNSDQEENQRVRKTAAAFKQAEINTPYYKVNFLASERRIPRAVVCTYPLGIRHTLEFQQRNWCFKNLFSEFTCRKTNWKTVPESEHHKYLPEKSQSMNVKTVSVSKKMPNLTNEEHVWKTFNLFESEIFDDSIAIFCGGPVWAIAWLPTPFQLEVDQYLAVSAQKKFQNNYKVSQSYSSEEVVQIWNFGCLDIDRPLSFKPRLEFCIAHEHGSVWAMEWCPSGCYEEENNEDPNVLRRMGLLALACSDGEIPVYSICFHDSLHLKNSEINMYKPKEHCRLILQDSDEQKLGSWDYQVTKLFWSKGKGHDVIAAGYSSGMVSLWDLTTESPLLKSIENGIIVLKPFLCFQPHFAPITAIQMYSQDGGKRWMTTGAWDRNSFLWDLHDIRSSVCSFTKRGSVTDGVLMTNWICYLFSSDDLHSLLHTVSIIQNPRDFGYRGCPILTANSMVMGLSASDWGNSIAQVSLAGELIATFPKQLLISYDPDKGMKYKRVLLGYAEPIDISLTVEQRVQKKMKKHFDNLHKAKRSKMLIQSVMGQTTEPYDEQPLNYEEASKQYGLIFCDINLLDHQNIPDDSLLMLKQSTRMKEAPIELYPFFCNNKVQWNPNKQAYLYIATAMQSGFVRLRCLRFLNTKLTTAL